MAVILDLVNAAGTRTGNEPITTLNDGSPVANIAGANYEQIKRAALTVYPWRFATKTVTLVALTGDVDLPWTYAYQIPNDLLKLRGVTVNGSPIDYERQSDKLLCDWGPDSDLIAKYTWLVPEADWPATFAEAITQFLEALFLRGVGERYQEADTRENVARLTLRAAKQEDAQNNSTRNPWTSPTLTARGAAELTEAAFRGRVL